MTKQEKLLSELGNVRDEFIEEGDLTAAAAVPRARNKQILTIGIAAALCCALITVGAALVLNRGDSDRMVWETKYVSQELHAELFPSDELGYIKRWDEKNTVERYPELRYKDVWYLASLPFGFEGCAIDVDRLGEQLGETVLTGEDIYTDSYYQIGGVIYGIPGINTDCAVAVLIDGEEQAFVYIDHYYQPSTLGDLLDGLSLESNLTFGSVYYDFWRDEKYVIVEFPKVPAEKLWELLSDRDTLTASDSEYWELDHHSVMSASVNVPLLGIENLSLSVTEDGYITTNLMGQGHAFFIGTEKTGAFVQYVLTNCKGYELVFITDGSDAVPEIDGSETDITIAYTSASAFHGNAASPVVSD